MIDLKAAIRTVPDFPTKGIMFRDITTLLLNPDAFRTAIDRIEEFGRSRHIDKILAIESRGFLFGAAVADRLGTGLIPIRKAGKLPGKIIKYEYALEYGTDTIEIHEDALKKGETVLVVDDLVATGGTLEAACRLAEKCGARVGGIAVVIDLAYLPWRKKLQGYDILSLVRYDSE
ncbi:Adenine phosphoribosyltransferase [Candidatus Zixiibacteriota bacterium]|nr:Adenine phosphoribosyltransferase [candidate division Zixibacteria bacterium]